MTGDDNPSGIFSRYQPRYAKVGIPTFPVGPDKKPRTRGYLRTGLRGSRKLAERFNDVNALGYAPGQRTGITLIDVDSRDYDIGRVEEEYGRTPIVVQTPGGYHLPYKHRGERRRVRPDPEKPIDFLGGGYVIAPPSLVTKGEYRIIRGSLEDLKNLPPIGKFLDSIRWNKLRDGDGRYIEMRKACQCEARYTDSRDDLLDWARTRNGEFLQPLNSTELDHAVDWAWTVQSEGRNWAGADQRITVEASLLKALHPDGGPDAVYLLMDLKLHHWGHKRFALATKAMAAHYGWGLRRFWNARDTLVDFGVIEQLEKAKSDRPAMYGWKAAA